MKKEYIWVIFLVVFVVCVESFKYIKKEFFPATEKNNVNIENIKVEADYEIETLDMCITVLESGDLKITENIIYNLKNESDQVFRNYTLEEYAAGKINSYQPEKLGITKIECDGKELYEDSVTTTGIIINKDKKIGLKRYRVEYVLEDSVEMCNNISEFLCNLNLSTFEKEIKNFNLTIETQNGGEILDARFLENDVNFVIENGVLRANKQNILPGSKVWVNVKLENESVPRTTRIMLEDRSEKFGE